MNARQSMHDKNWQTEVEKHRMGGGGVAATQVASLIESHAFFFEEGFTFLATPGSIAAQVCPSAASPRPRSASQRPGTNLLQLF
jgi:hypothetical protein